MIGNYNILSKEHDQLVSKCQNDNIKLSRLAKSLVILYDYTPFCIIISGDLLELHNNYMYVTCICILKTVKNKAQVRSNKNVLGKYVNYLVYV